jgi:hypothetical protein
MESPIVAPIATRDDQRLKETPELNIEPEIILPSQCLSHRPHDMSAERALLWAVFIDGIQSYCVQVIIGAVHGPEFREVERWIFSREEDALTSFHSLCELFEIDARGLRRGLLEFREHPTREVAQYFRREAA